MKARTYILVHVDAVRGEECANRINVTYNEHTIAKK
jgi:hypothetical protein